MCEDVSLNGSVWDLDTGMNYTCCSHMPTGSVLFVSLLPCHVGSKHYRVEKHIAGI